MSLQQDQAAPVHLLCHPPIMGRAVSELAGVHSGASLLLTRPYACPRAFLQIGSGVQIISTALVTFFLATLGFLSPASRGALVTTTIVMYVWLAVLGGFVAVGGGRLCGCLALGRGGVCAWGVWRHWWQLPCMLSHLELQVQVWVCLLSLCSVPAL